jgi:hypothetical protein
MTSSSAVVDQSRDFFLATPQHDSLEGDKLRCRRFSLFGERLTYRPGIEGYYPTHSQTYVPSECHCAQQGMLYFRYTELVTYPFTRDLGTTARQS